MHPQNLGSYRAVIVPAVYKFKFPYSQVGHNDQYSKWHWCKASDLLEAVTYIQHLKGVQPEHSLMNLFKTYSHLNKTGVRNPFIPHSRGVMNYVRNSSINIVSLTLKPDSPNALKPDDYVPAKWALAVINAVKHPTIDKLRQAIGI